MPNLLATRGGRLAAFFLLYVTEGIPQGFTAIALATHMRRQGVSAAAIGGFVATLYLPWSWKWLVAPAVDAFYSDRLGRRRAWIVGCQLLMAATLLAGMPIDFTTRLAALAWIVFAHNVAAATQDVAIDALAVSTLPVNERGVANGLMFAGAYTGQAVGGSGALLLAQQIGLRPTFLFVAGSILLVTFGVSLWLRERPAVDDGDAAVTARRIKSPADVASRLFTSVRQAVGAMVSSRGARLGIVFALLPAGSYALGSALSQNLAVDLGLSDQRIATLGIIGTVGSASGCVIGGLLSDRFGRRRMLAVYVLLTTLPTAMFAIFLQSNGWTRPGAGAPPGAVVSGYIIASISFTFLQGLVWGSRPALFMDLCSRAVAATQFTAYMSLMNLVLAYTAWWQGRAIERWGYPTTMVIDCIFGCACLAVLPFIHREPEPLEAESRGFEVVRPAAADPA